MHRAPAIALGPPSVNRENARLRTASTHRGADPRGDRADHQPYATGMFNRAQNVTVNGGVFLSIQGNVSYMTDECLQPNEVTAEIILS
jgi:hypothetical protein